MWVEYEYLFEYMTNSSISKRGPFFVYFSLILNIEWWDVQITIINIISHIIMQVFFGSKKSYLYILLVLEALAMYVLCIRKYPYPYAYAYSKYANVLQSTLWIKQF